MAYKFHPNTGLRRSNGVVAAAMKWYRWLNAPGDKDLRASMASQELNKLARACQRLQNFKDRSKK